MKKILIVLLGLFGVAYGQCGLLLSDSVFNNSVTLIAQTTARVNGDASNGDVGGSTITLRYVRVGHTDTVVSTTVWPTSIRNLTGLTPGTQYVYYYTINCSTDNIGQLGRYYFTTAANIVPYTPMTASGYQLKYIKIDSGALFTPGDTVLGRAPNTGGTIKFKSSDSLFYYYNGLIWKPLAIDSFGIVGLLNDKVDSVTIVGDILYYWKLGVGYGYTLPAVSADVTYFQNGGPPGFNLLRQTNDSTYQIRSIDLGYGLLGDSTTADSVLAVRVDTSNQITSRLQAQHLIDSLAAIVTTGLATKEASFTETVERFTSSTSLTVTVANTPKTSKARMVFFNGVEMDPSNVSIVGTGFTISGIARETSDVITVKYSY